MKTIQELRDDLSHKIRSAEDIQNLAEKTNRPLTAEETKAVKALHDEAAAIEADIKTLEEQEKLAKTTAEWQAKLAKPAPRQTVAPEANDGNAPVLASPDIRAVPVHQRIGGLKAFTAKSAGGSQAQANYNAYESAMFIAAMFYNNAKADRWLREHRGHDWRAAHTEGTNTQGGYLVPAPMETAIIDLRENYGVFRQNTRVRPMASDVLNVPKKSGRWSASFTAESTALTESSSTYTNIQFVAKKLGGYATLSSELAEDAVVSIVDDLVRDFAYGLALKEDQCAFIGDGTTTYGGIAGLTKLFNDTPLSGTQLAGAISAASNHDTFAEIDVDDLSSMMAVLPDYARMNAKFYCSRVAAEMVFGSIKASGGGNNITDLNGNVGMNYLGYPIVVSQVLPNGPSTDYSSLAMLFFGDLTLSSSLAERRGIRIARSDEYRWVQDDISLKVTERIDIINHDIGSSTAGDYGAIVSLNGE